MRIKLAVVLSLVAFVSLANLNALAADADADPGLKLALDKNKGNCVACHAIPSDPKIEAPGNIGPALTGTKALFPDRAKLRAQIWDATVANPDSVMPPFGRNKVLTEQEIDEVTDYVMGL